MSDISPIFKPVTVGVAGGTGSGKTTIAQQIIERIGEHNIAYLPHDAYYRNLIDIPHAAGQAANFDHPDALETALLVDHMRQLQDWNEVQIPIYDFSTYRRSTETKLIKPQPIILVEGILIFIEPDLRKLMDVKVFVDTDADIRFIRRLKRDVAERGRSVDSVINQYLDNVRPMHMEFVEPSKRYADVIIPEGGYNSVAIDLVGDHVRRMMTRYHSQEREG